MTINVPVVINLSNDMTKKQASAAKTNVAKKIYDILRCTRKIHMGFLWIPFKRCIVAEATRGKRWCGSEVSFESVEGEFLKWCETILEVISSTMLIKKRMCDEIIVKFSDGGMKYGWTCTISYPASDESYAFRCMPTREEAFSEFAEERYPDSFMQFTLSGSVVK